MQNVIKVLIGLAALAFVLAAVMVVFHTGPMGAVTAEGLSRACTNLALIAIALSVLKK